jgi:hypothetical protein
VTSTSTANGAKSVTVNTDALGATLVVIGNPGGGQPTVSNQTTLFQSNQSAPNGAASFAFGGSGSNTHSFGGMASSVCDAWAGIHIIEPQTASSTSSGLLLMGV